VHWAVDVAGRPQTDESPQYGSLRPGKANKGAELRYSLFSRLSLSPLAKSVPLEIEIGHELASAVGCQTVSEDQAQIVTT
jgi:hypothetical protein